MESAAAGRPDSERFSNLKLAFSMATHCLLTACSREDFGAYFSFLNPYQQDALYKLYTQMVVSVQENLQEEFRDVCEETRAWCSFMATGISAGETVIRSQIGVLELPLDKDASSSLL